MESNLVDEVVNQIKDEARKIDIHKISFKATGFLYSAISRSTASMNRSNEMAEAFEKYAKEETNPTQKARFEAIAKHYSELARQSQESINKNRVRLDMANAQIEAISENMQKLLSESDVAKILDALRNLINSLEAVGYNTQTLKELAEKLEALLGQPFTLVLEYVVSW